MKEQSYRIYIGLGNPGKKYENTRHNIGFRVVQKYAEQLGITFREEGRFQAQIARGVDQARGDQARGDQEREVHLLLPQTYMNESGISVRKYLDFYQLAAEAIVVVIDDIALLFEEIRFRMFGGTGGHNGLKSIQTHLGTQEYKRLRMGIGAPQCERVDENTLSDYVLSPFTPEERAKLPTFIKRGADILSRLAHEDAERVMNEVNKKPNEVNQNPLLKGQEKQHGE